MEMHFEPERAVRPLHKRERAYLGIPNRTQSKLSLRTATQRALQRFGEGAKNTGTKYSVVAQRAAKSPESSTKGASRPSDGSGPRARRSPQDGRSFGDRMRAQGVTFRGGDENIAGGQRTPQAVHASWMNSEGHPRNIMNERYGRIGVGYEECGGRHYWVQVFAN